MIPRYSRPEMSSLWTEEAKFGSWLEVELLACEAWARKGKIPKRSLATIKRKAGFNVRRIEKLEKTLRHDVIAFLTCVGERVGPDSRYIHLGLTSSDVVDTAQNLRLVRAGRILQRDVEALISLLAKLARKHRLTVMIGRTHGVHAEPITLGLKFLLWREDFVRARARLAAAIEEVRVGKLSGAVGTYAHAGPEIEIHVCRKLGLKPDPISTQVVQRDRHAAFVQALALVGAAVEKIATEIRHLQRTEVYELEEPFGKGQKGSSAMPHKRNPVVCEQLSGLARVLRANALAALENVALWHERDISHSSVERVILPDSTILLDYMLDRLRWVLEGITVKKDRLKRNLELTGGLLFSQKILLALIERGLSREDAYAIVQRNAMKCWETGRPLRELLLEDDDFYAMMNEADLAALMDYQSFLGHVDKIFERCLYPRRTRRNTKI
ncbi:MAG: adenylosuccinate lyase [bacterium]